MPEPLKAEICINEWISSIQKIGYFEFPMVIDRLGTCYLYCTSNYFDAKSLAELFNMDDEVNKYTRAGFPEHRYFTGFSGYFIHLCPKY